MPRVQYEAAGLMGDEITASDTGRGSQAWPKAQGC